MYLPVTVTWWKERLMIAVIFTLSLTKELTFPMLQHSYEHHYQGMEKLQETLQNIRNAVTQDTI